MKFNKWTLGLAAVGAVSMASAVRADEAKMSAVQTALSNTTISGFVDIGIQGNFGNQSVNSTLPPYANNSYGEDGQRNPIRDGFSLNAVNIAIDRPLDDSSWSAGYHVELNTGVGAISGVSLANNFDNGTSDMAGSQNEGNLVVRQAYITMRTPLGNGIDWKLGVFDGITGYESNTGYKNPNYTRSYGYIINPTTFTGILGTYQVISGVSVSAGVANRGNYQGFGQNNNDNTGTGTAIAQKDFIFATSLTAPESWGWLKGSALNAGTVQSFDNNGVDIYSVNLSLATPVAGLKVGVAWDALNSRVIPADFNIYGVYATYQATDKLAFNLRGEFVDGTDADGGKGSNPFNNLGRGEEVTATIEYNLWANMLTRVEFRWDHAEFTHPYSNSETGANAFLLAFNAVYKF